MTAKNLSFRPAECMETMDGQQYNRHVESNSGARCTFHRTVRFNRGDDCKLLGWAELNRGDRCVLDGVVELNRGDNCVIRGHVKVNVGDFCLIDKGGIVDNDIGDETQPGTRIDFEEGSDSSVNNGALECLVCMDAQKVMMFSECHHLCVCGACGEMLKKDGEFVCPLCRLSSPGLIHVHY